MAIGADRVQVAKQEDSAHGGEDGQNNPYGGPISITPESDAVECAGVYLQEVGRVDETVWIEADASVVRIMDSRHTTPSPSVTERVHRTLRQLSHMVADGPHEGFGGPLYSEPTPTNAIFPTAITWYDNVSKTNKIASTEIAWDGAFPTQVTHNVFKTNGTDLAAKSVDVFDYTSSIFSPKITRTVTEY